MSVVESLDFAEHIVDVYALLRRLDIRQVIQDLDFGQRMGAKELTVSFCEPRVKGPCSRCLQRILVGGFLHR